MKILTIQSGENGEFRIGKVILAQDFRSMSKLFFPAFVFNDDFS